MNALNLSGSMPRSDLKFATITSTGAASTVVFAQPIATLLTTLQTDLASYVTAGNGLAGYQAALAAAQAAQVHANIEVALQTTAYNEAVAAATADTARQTAFGTSVSTATSAVTSAASAVTSAEATLATDLAAFDAAKVTLRVAEYEGYPLATYEASYNSALATVTADKATLLSAQNALIAAQNTLLTAQSLANDVAATSAARAAVTATLASATANQTAVASAVSSATSSISSAESSAASALSSLKTASAAVVAALPASFVTQAIAAEAVLVDGLIQDWNGAQEWLPAVGSPQGGATALQGGTTQSALAIAPSRTPVSKVTKRVNDLVIGASFLLAYVQTATIQAPSGNAGTVAIAPTGTGTWKTLAASGSLVLSAQPGTVINIGAASATFSAAGDTLQVLYQG